MAEYLCEVADSGCVCCCWLVLQAAQMTTPARPRFTPQLLNMRRVEAMLAEQKHFAKANKVRQHMCCPALSLL
jgi:hypothetical protein